MCCARGEACEAAAAPEGVLVLNLAPEAEILTLLALLDRLCAMLTRLAHMGARPSQRRSARVCVSGSVSVSDQRKAASVGGSRERERHATLSVFPQDAHELAHALAHATR